MHWVLSLGQTPGELTAAQAIQEFTSAPLQLRQQPLECR